MEFKDLGDGMCFPSTVPNGELFGFAPGVTGEPVKLMAVTVDGLSLPGVLIDWHTIDRVSADDNVVIIHSSKYAARDFTFFLEGMRYRRNSYSDMESMHRGYPIVYTLMNRITYELQLIEREMDVF